MKVVTLPGGFGTRLAKDPKADGADRSHPILWHIMKFSASYRFEELLGYKAEVVKNFFLQSDGRVISPSICAPAR
jgi:hypothetical protein